MNADDLIQEFAIEVLKEPLNKVTDEPDYPNLGNPLHLYILLLDCDGQTISNGMLGFIENCSGGYLQKTIDALQQIGANKSAEVFQNVKKCMIKYNVTWERLRRDFEGSEMYEISSFELDHGKELNDFSEEINQLSDDFYLFRVDDAPDGAYPQLVNYLEDKVDIFLNEVKKRNGSV